MAEFVMKSRKKETDTPDLELEKLEKPTKSESFEFLESKVEEIHSEKIVDALPCLPWQLERLISAACGDVLPQGTVNLTSGLVPDLGRYVLGWGCSYLTGDRTEAERRLWEAHWAWQSVS